MAAEKIPLPGRRFPPPWSVEENTKMRPPFLAAPSIEDSGKEENHKSSPERCDDNEPKLPPL
jgi:hypothetical protein